MLLDAWAILAQGGFAPPLLVLGEGIERPGLERRAQELGLGGVVRFLGSVPDAPALMANEGFYVAPSRYEGLPGSVVEAMALGLPVVATAVGGHLDLLQGCAPEWLVPPEDPAALAARVKDLLALAPAAREALSRRLQETAYRDFAPTGIARATLEVYRAAGARGPDRPGRWSARNGPRRSTLGRRLPDHRRSGRSRAELQIRARRQVLGNASCRRWGRSLSRRAPAGTVLAFHVARCPGAGRPSIAAPPRKGTAPSLFCDSNFMRGKRLRRPTVPFKSLTHAAAFP